MECIGWFLAFVLIVFHNELSDWLAALIDRMAGHK